MKLVFSHHASHARGRRAAHHHHGVHLGLVAHDLIDCHLQEGVSALHRQPYHIISKKIVSTNCQSQSKRHLPKRQTRGKLHQYMKEKNQGAILCHRLYMLLRRRERLCDAIAKDYSVYMYC